MIQLLVAFMGTVENILISMILTPGDHAPFSGIFQNLWDSRVHLGQLSRGMMSLYVTSCRQAASSVQFTAAVVFSELSVRSADQLLRLAAVRQHSAD